MAEDLTDSQVEKFVERIDVVFLTSQEAHMVGSSEDEVKGTPNWYRPRIFQTRTGVDIDSVNVERLRCRYFVSNVIGPLGFKGQVVFTLEPLDPKTGATLRDPQIVGELPDDGKYQLVKLPNSKELTAKLAEWFRKIGDDPLYRD